MIDVAHESSHASTFAPRCLSIDLEVGVRDGRIHRFAAVRGDTGQSFVSKKAIGGPRSPISTPSLKARHFCLDTT